VTEMGAYYVICRDCGKHVATAYNLKLDNFRSTGYDTEPERLVCPQCGGAVFEAFADPKRT